MTTKGTDNRFRSLTVVGESGTPSTPGSGDFKLYVADDGTFYLMDDTGTPTALGGGGFSDPMTTRGDIIIRNASNVTARLAKGSADTFLHSDGTDVGYAAVTDAMLSTSDTTTNNASTSKHGFAPKYPNDATKYLDGTGAYSVPPGSGGGGAVGALAIQSACNAASAGSSTIDVTISAASSGNVLYAFVGAISTNTVSSLACTNVTWTRLVQSTSGTSPLIEIWKGVVSGGSSGTTVTVTYSASTSERSCSVIEFASSVASTVDQTASRTRVAAVYGSGYLNTTPAILPTDTNALVLAASSTDNGSVRFGTSGGLWVATEAFATNAGNLPIGAWQGSYYCFPGKVPIALGATGPNSGNFSSVIVSLKT